MTAHRPVRRHWLQAKTKLKQNVNEGCNSCAFNVQVLQDLFYSMFYFTCDRSFKHAGAPSSETDLIGNPKPDQNKLDCHRETARCSVLLLPTRRYCFPHRLLVHASRLFVGDFSESSRPSFVKFGTDTQNHYYCQQRCK